MARRAKLAIVSNNTVEYEHDPIFFTKADIKIGTRLVCYGRRDPRSEWVVSAISTIVKRPSGYVLQVVREVHHLNDVITLRRVERVDGVSIKRQPTFGALSYSAIWRLAQ